MGYIDMKQGQTEQIQAMLMVLDDIIANSDSSETSSLHNQTVNLHRELSYLMSHQRRYSPDAAAAILFTYQQRYDNITDKITQRID